MTHRLRFKLKWTKRRSQAWTFKEGDYKPSHFKSGAIQLLIGIAILSLGLCALYAMSKLMDRAVHQYEIDKEHLGADYGTIFKTPLNRVHLLDGLRIPGARFVYALESQDPLALWHPSLFPTIKLHPGRWWPYGTYPWITKCLYRPSGLEGAEGETFVYCDDTMQHVCVLGYYGKNETYLPLFPTAIGARTPDEMLKTGKYEKIVEFDVPESVTSDEIFAIRRNSKKSNGRYSRPRTQPHASFYPEKGMRVCRLKKTDSYYMCGHLSRVRLDKCSFLFSAIDAGVGCPGSPDITAN